jgi:DEAD/DEAH box helicase domain-containing protein
MVTNAFIRFLKNLKLVAVDELHYYSNIFGRYAKFLRRQVSLSCSTYPVMWHKLFDVLEEFAQLLEVGCSLYRMMCIDKYYIDRHSRFVSCSATISNPMQHMKSIFGINASLHVFFVDMEF